MNWHKNPWVGFGLQAGSVLLIVCISWLWLTRYPLRWDLTEEGRHTLSAATKTQLQRLKAPLQVEVYLTGELPAGFRRLQKSLQDILQRMQKESPQGVHIRYIDPTAKKLHARTQSAYIRSLAQKGIQPTNLSYTEENRTIERLIFPGILLTYQGMEVGITLLKGNRRTGPENILNQSIEQLEYALLKGIGKLLRPEPRRLGLVQGHDNIDSLQRTALTQTLANEGYAVQPIYLNQQNNLLEQLPTLLIIKPERPFTKSECYRIDQYVMKGGQLILFLEGLHVAMDSVSHTGTVALEQPTGLEKLLFHYGVRLRPQLLTDLYCAKYPVIAGKIGDQSQMRLLPWPFFAVLHNRSEHPITRNIESLFVRYGTSLDTVKAAGIRKAPLLWSSPYTRQLGAPVVVALNQLQETPQQQQYNAGKQVVAYLLEGPFQSAFRHRVPPPNSPPLHAQGLPSKILVVGDGDFPLGDIHPRTGQVMDIGMYLPENMQYGNKDFLLQALDYYYDQIGAILTRNRQIFLRPLNKQKIQEESTFWQMFNVLLPLAVLGILGIVKLRLRRTRYTAS